MKIMRSMIADTTSRAKISKNLVAVLHETETKVRANKVAEALTIDGWACAGHDKAALYCVGALSRYKVFDKRGKADQED